MKGWRRRERRGRGIVLKGLKSIYRSFRNPYDGTVDMLNLKFSGISHKGSNPFKDTLLSSLSYPPLLPHSGTFHIVEGVVGW